MSSIKNSTGLEPPGRATGKILLGLVITAVAVLGCWITLRSPQTRQAAESGADGSDFTEPAEQGLEWRSQPEYVGSAACRNCHPDQFASFRETKHSRTLVRVAPDKEPGDASFDDRPAARRYRVKRVGGQLVQEVSLLGENSAEFGRREFPLRFRVGSGHFGRTYLIATNGFLVEAPISWFESRQAWGLSPGFEGPHRLPFGRTVPEECLFCHSGNVERSTLSDVRMRILEDSIGCERCHGPGREHVEQESTRPAASGERDAAIVNPRRLTRKLAEDVCRQCHLQGDIHVPAGGGHAEDYRPGEPLEKYRQEYRIRKPRDAMEIVGHAEQLAHSACYRQSGTLTCMTCHDPHAPVPPADRVEHFRSICLSCHADRGCSLDVAERTRQRQNDCAACHMPGKETVLPHVAFTHHQIGIHPVSDKPPPADGGDWLIPLFDASELSLGERQRSLGLAWERFSVHPDAGDESSPVRRRAGFRAVQLLATLKGEFADAAAAAALARLYRSRGQMPEAEQAARRVLGFDHLSTSDKTTALAVLGTASFQASRFVEAAGYFADLTGLRRSAEDWYYLGLCESYCSNADAAIRALETSYRLDPEHVETCEMLASIYRTKRNMAAERRMRDEIQQLKRRVHRGNETR
ncbi:MAG: cytochrome c3 family protein [Deltaproteobacteria bacterium]